MFDFSKCFWSFSSFGQMRYSSTSPSHHNIRLELRIWDRPWDRPWDLLGPPKFVETRRFHQQDVGPSSLSQRIAKLDTSRTSRTCFDDSVFMQFSAFREECVISLRKAMWISGMLCKLIYFPVSDRRQVEIDQDASCRHLPWKSKHIETPTHNRTIVVSMLFQWCFNGG